MAKTISHCQGKGSLTHNTRAFSAKNVDISRTSDNVIFVNQPIGQAYDEIFGAAVERYNTKQKRADRKIKNGYYEHLFKRTPSNSVVTSSDKRKSFYEDVVQIGTKDDTGIATKDAQTAAECLTEYAKGFAGRNPNFHVFLSVLHNDEATPHLHIDYIPVGHYKQGVDTQNGLAQALKEMGYGTGKDAINRWRLAERAVLEQICREHDIEIAAPEKSRGSLTVEEYKEYAHVKEQVDEKKHEVERLENKANCAEKLLKHREELLEHVENTIDNLDNQYQEKNAAVKQLDTELEKKNAALTETAAALADNKALLDKSAKKVSKIKDINEMQTGKTLLGKTTIDDNDLNELKGLAKKQLAAESKENELQKQITALKDDKKKLFLEKEALIEEKGRVEQENHGLRKENNELRSVYGKTAVLKLQAEFDKLQQTYNKVLEFIEQLNLKEKLEAFLNPPNLSKTHKRGLHR